MVPTYLFKTLFLILYHLILINYVKKRRIILINIFLEMDNEFKVIAVDVRLDLAGRFQQTQLYVAHLAT